jgi:hypothetical protein
MVFAIAVCMSFSRLLELVKSPDVARFVCATTPVTDRMSGSGGAVSPAVAGLVVTSTYRYPFQPYFGSYVSGPPPLRM